MTRFSMPLLGRLARDAMPLFGGFREGRCPKTAMSGEGDAPFWLVHREAMPRFRGGRRGPGRGSRATTGPSPPGEDVGETLATSGGRRNRATKLSASCGYSIGTSCARPSAPLIQHDSCLESVFRKDRSQFAPGKWFDGNSRGHEESAPKIAVGERTVVGVTVARNVGRIPSPDPASAMSSKLLNGRCEDRPRNRVVRTLVQGLGPRRVVEAGLGPSR